MSYHPPAGKRQPPFPRRPNRYLRPDRQQPRRIGTPRRRTVSMSGRGTPMACREPTTAAATLSIQTPSIVGWTASAAYDVRHYGLSSPSRTDSKTDHGQEQPYQRHPGCGVRTGFTTSSGRVRSPTRDVASSTSVARCGRWNPSAASSRTEFIRCGRGGRSPCEPVAGINPTRDCADG